MPPSEKPIDNLRYGVYIFYIVLYFILFGFLFQPNVENLVMIILFVLVVISGFNVIMDIKDNKEVFFYFKLFYEFMDQTNGSYVTDLLFSPFSLFIICILLIVMVALYMTNIGSVPIGFIYFLATYLGVISFFTVANSIRTGVPIYIVIGIPLILVIVSLIMMMVTIYNYNTSSGKNGLYTKFIFLSSIDSTNTQRYKTILITEFIFMLLLLMYLFIYLKYIKNTPKTDNNTVQSLLYVAMLIIYSLSGCLVFFSNNLLQLKFP